MNTEMIDALTSRKSPHRDLPYVTVTLLGQSVDIHFQDLDRDGNGYIGDIVDSRGYSLVSNNSKQHESLAFNALQESDEFNEQMISAYFSECDEVNLNAEIDKHQAA